MGQIAEKCVENRKNFLHAKDLVHLIYKHSVFVDGSCRGEILISRLVQGNDFVCLGLRCGAILLVAK